MTKPTRKSLLGFGLVILATATILFTVITPADCPTPHTLRVGETELILEVADTPFERAKGLSNRDNLSQNAGMLFAFSTPDIYGFWMKNTRIPLDILWINEGEVVEIATLPAESEGKPTPQHIPSHKADRVLELSAGRAASLGITVGTKLDLSDSSICEE